ncbi:MAG: peptidase S8 and S53 subtilisin kexin sedolisin [Arthrospira sp. PLM2.Bin9]|nr:S8 family serine peptidase [Arthrospira sp. PLM2.Bin9]TVU55649.1 MAG: peptidase S8 and S53 subtilisin kexin sedolisin [Arthrospira sp. PLM2.Bin9]
MTINPKISPAFAPFLSHTDPQGKQDAIVIFQGQYPTNIAPRDSQQRFNTLQQTATSHQAEVSKLAASYKSAVGQNFNVSVIGSGALPIATVEVTAETLPALVEQPGVVAVLPNQKIKLIEPSAIDYQQLRRQEENNKLTWGLELLEIPKMWEKTKGKGVTVSVLDTGVHGDHPALKDRVKGFVVIDPLGRRITATPSFDGGNHGTHVCGTVAGGKTESGVSIGVAPEADLLAGGVLIGNATLRTLIEGISWSIENGADVINMSLGMSYYEPLFAQVFDMLINQYDILPVVAVGNENHGNTSCPGNAHNAFSIGAVEMLPNSELGITFFSSGASLVFPDDAPNRLVTKPDISAPGAQVYSAVPPTKQANGSFEYTYMDGTSMATPHVAGVVALLLAAQPDVPVSKIVEVLRETAEHPGGEQMRPDNRWGWGLIKPWEALQALK